MRQIIVEKYEDLYLIMSADSESCIEKLLKNSYKLETDWVYDEFLQLYKEWSDYDVVLRFALVSDLWNSNIKLLSYTNAVVSHDNVIKEEYLYLSTVETNPHEKGKKYCSLLMDFIKRICIEHKINKIVLENEGGYIAYLCYKHLGKIIEEHEDENKTRLVISVFIE